MVAKSMNPYPYMDFEEDFLPEDIAHRIASLLPVSDVCSLGSTSWFWRNLCDSDTIWISLSKERWPSVRLLEDSHPVEKCGGQEERKDLGFASSSKVWKNVYIKWHKEMAWRAATVAKSVKECSPHESLEVGDYLKAVKELCHLELGFKDVRLYIFTKANSVLLNLIGLHYSIFWLGMQTADIAEALSSCRISERKICIRWWKLGQWVRGFRQRDETRVHRMSLIDILKPEKQEVLGVLERGVVHEVLRVQISTELRLETTYIFQRKYFGDARGLDEDCLGWFLYLGKLRNVPPTNFL